jgi:CBS domain-containing protein
MLTLGHREIVVAVDDRPHGVITIRQLARLLQPSSDGWTPHHAADLLPARNSRLLPDLDLSTAAAVMTRAALEAMPVVDHRGALLGVITHRHLVRHLARRTTR